MEKQIEENQIVKSGIKVSGIKTIPTKKVVFIERKIRSETIGKEIASRIMGKLLGFDDLFDPKTNRFLTEEELKAKGAVFISISLNKILGDSDVVKKSRRTKEPTPYIRKTVRYQIIGNINWESYINKRGNGNFVANLERANGVVNVAECKAVGMTIKGNYTLNGVVFKSIESVKYFDIDNDEYPDKKALEAEYLKKPSAESKQKEADKHGIDIRFDPKYRTTRIDSCDNVRVFQFDYKPRENPQTK